mmetsp:Transcript_28553/g.68034  ORF Transcript_28553/g.68034 Transcript_28553/m.68034 type:complete len:215 (-) Transcript_28553:3655-4299(-)
MSLRMRRRESSESSPAEPRIRSALTTSWRSVLAMIWSQKLLTPPATTGMDAVSVVFICSGGDPSLGPGSAVEVSTWVLSIAETTKCTNTLLERSEDGEGSQSMPRGMLKTTNWSGTSAGETHMRALGEQSWLAAPSSSEVSQEKRELKSAWFPPSNESSSSSYCEQAWKKPSGPSTLSVAVRKKVPCATRTESRGMRPVSIGRYWSPIVNVTCR